MPGAGRATAAGAPETDQDSPMMSPGSNTAADPGPPFTLGASKLASRNMFSCAGLEAEAGTASPRPAMVAIDTTIRHFRPTIPTATPAHRTEPSPVRSLLGY